MHRKFCLVLFLLYVIIVSVFANVRDESGDVSVNNEDEAEESEIFQPTDQWQEVKKGQPIPRGLHVRMNVYTGKTEAKLLEPESADSKPPTSRTRTDMVAVSREEDKSYQEPLISKEELRKVLSRTGVDSITQDFEDVSKQYKSYEHLKEDFDDVNLAVKTDMELLFELTREAKQLLLSKADEDNIVNTLTDLEYLVHQIDNGQEFERLGGLTDVVLPALNASSDKVRGETLWLLGAAVQSNPKVQIAALDAGIVPTLIRTIVLDEDQTVRLRAVYALGCLVRHFPSAQAELISDSGLGALAKLFDSEGIEDFKTKVKIITLIHDLVLEHKEVENTVNHHSSKSSQNPFNLSSSSDDALQKMYQHQRDELGEKLRHQYRVIGLERRLLEGGWCWRLSLFMVHLQRDSFSSSNTVQLHEDLGSILSKDIPIRPEHDIIEKVAATMAEMSDLCIDHFRANSDLNESMQQLIVFYQNLGEQEEMIRKDTDFNNDNKCTEGECNIGSNEDVMDKEIEFYYSGVAEKLAGIAKLINNPLVVPLPPREEL